MTGQWRTLSVAVEAQISGYMSAMTRGAAATQQFARDVTKLATDVDKLDAASGRLKDFGGDMTRSVTLPLTLAGAASYKMASDFNGAFMQMQTLAGVTAGEVDGLKDAVNKLATETAQSPQELAQGLYFIRSAGLEGSDALDTLEASAKGSAIGLGETAAVADVVTSALNTYGAENLSAAQAVDMLSQSVAIGKGEAAEFAPQLGALLPIAQQIGVGFDQVAGSVAFLTQTNGDVARSSTMVAGVLNNLLAPSKQAKDVLAEYGLSAESVRSYLADNGLIATLEMLNGTLGGNKDQIGRLIEDSEALNGFFGLLRNGGADATAAIDSVTNSAGYLDDAFAKLQATDEFKIRQDLVELQKTAIEIGNELLPVFADVAEVIGTVARMFALLPAPVQTGLVAFGALLAVLGPTASVMGNVAGAASSMSKAWDSKRLDSFRLGLEGVTEKGAGASNAMGGLINKMGGLSTVAIAGAGAVAILGFAMYQYAGYQQNVAERADDVADGIAAIRNEARTTGKTLEEAFRDTQLIRFAETMGGALADTGVSLTELRDGLTGSAADYDKMVRNLIKGGGLDLGLLDQVGRLRTQFKGAETETQRNAEATKELGAEQSGLAPKIEATTGALRGQADAAGEVTDVFVEQTDVIRGLFDARQASAAADQAVIDAQGAVAEAHRGVTEAQEKVTDAQRQAVDASEAIVDAQKALADAQRGVQEALRGVESAQREAADAAEGVVSAAEALARAQQEATGDSDEMRDAVQRVTDAERSLADAQRGSLGAQQALTDARSAYGDTMQSLDDDAADAADAVIRAEIRIRKAREDLANLGLNKDGTRDAVSADDRKLAELDVARAERDLRDAEARRDEAAEVARRNREAGVEGSDAVVAAQDAVAEAAGREEEAERGLADAHANVASVRETAAARVIDAEGGLADAINNRAAADQRVVYAKQGVVDAQDRVAEAADRVAGAQRGVHDAQQKIIEARQGVVDAHGAVAKAEQGVFDAAVAAAWAHNELWVKLGLAKDGAGITARELRTLAGTMTADSPLRKNLLDTAAALDDLAGDYQVNVNLGGNAADAILNGVSSPFLEILATATGKSTPGGKSGGKSGGPAGDKGPTPTPTAATTTAPATYPGGWVRQPNGRWYHPRQPGEEDYGDGYSDTGPPALQALRAAVLIQAREAEAARAAHAGRLGAAYIPRFGAKAQADAALTEAAGWYGGMYLASQDLAKMGATPTGRAGARAGGYASTPSMAPGWAQPAAFTATHLNQSRTIDVGGVHVDARGIQSPEAVATAVGAEMGWRLSLTG